jgi:hypothetical protein
LAHTARNSARDIPVVLVTFCTASSKMSGTLCWTKSGTNVLRVHHGQRVVTQYGTESGRADKDTAWN